MLMKRKYQIIISLVIVSVAGMAYFGLQALDDFDDNDVPVKKNEPVLGKSKGSANLLADHHAAGVAYAIVVMPKSYLSALKRFSRSRMARELKILPAEIGWKNGELVAIPKQAIKKREQTQEAKLAIAGKNTVSTHSVGRAEVKIALRNAAMLFLLQSALAHKLNYDRTN